MSSGDKARYFIRLPKNCDLYKIYPPLVKEVCSNEFFGQYQKILTITQEEIEDDIYERVPEEEQKREDFRIPTPFEFLFAFASMSKEALVLTQEAFKFFIHEDVTLLPDMGYIIIGDLKDILPTLTSLDDLRIIKAENYFDFQNEVRGSMGMEAIKPYEPEKNEKIRRMKAKARYRDKVKAKNGNGISLETTLSSICCMGIGITPLNVGELSYASLDMLMQRRQMKESYELDIQSLLAGADSKKVKPKYWIKNLD